MIVISPGTNVAAMPLSCGVVELTSDAALAALGVSHEARRSDSLTRMPSSHSVEVRIGASGAVSIFLVGGSGAFAAGATIRTEIGFAGVIASNAVGATRAISGGSGRSHGNHEAWNK